MKPVAVSPKTFSAGWRKAGRASPVTNLGLESLRFFRMAALARAAILVPMILYIILIIATMALGGIAAWRVRSTFNRFAQVRSTSGLTGAQVARQILQAHGIHDVEVVPVEGNLTDHYDPAHKRLALSEPVFHSSSLSAQGVAAMNVATPFSTLRPTHRCTGAWPQSASRTLPAAPFSSS